MDIENVEIKLRVPDAEAAREAIARIADGPPERLEQKDTYFHTPDGAYLKLREENGRSSLIGYRRALADDPQPSDIRLAMLDGASDVGDALAHALGIRAVVEKVRQLYFRGQTRIHLDQVRGLGAFVELEVVLRKGQSRADGLGVAREVLAALSLAGAEAQDRSYRDLLGDIR